MAPASLLEMCSRQIIVEVCVTSAITARGAGEAIGLAPRASGNKLHC